MRRFFASRYAQLFWAWRNGWESEVRQSTIAFFSLVFLSFFAFLLLPELRLEFSARLPAETGTFFSIFGRDLALCALSVAIGFLPFLRLPALPLGICAVWMGGFAASSASVDSTMLLYAARVLPQGIFLTPALLLAFSMGMFVCRHLSRRCRRDETALSLLECLLLSARLLIFFLLPLLLAAAAAQRWITPLAAQLL